MKQILKEFINRQIFQRSTRILPCNEAGKNTTSEFLIDCIYVNIFFTNRRFAHDTFFIFIFSHLTQELHILEFSELMQQKKNHSLKQINCHGHFSSRCGTPELQKTKHYCTYGCITALEQIFPQRLYYHHLCIMSHLKHR